MKCSQTRKDTRTWTHLLCV